MSRCDANLHRMTFTTPSADNGPLLWERLISPDGSGRNKQTMFPATPELHWRDGARWPRNAWPAPLGAWLLGEDSLTRSLRARCAGEFRVSILHEGWGSPSASERQVLGMAPRSRAWVREVYLWCGAERWVYARTVLPGTTLTGRLRYLRRLGTRPLGEVIFADLSMRRGPVQVTRVASAAGVPEQPSRAADATVWGRRSVFWLHRKPLLVCEFFLPTMIGALE